MPWEITPARESDIPRLCRLLGVLFVQEAEFTPDESKQAQALKAIITQPSVGEILVARDGDSIVGMVSLLYSVSTALGGRVATMEDMVVEPSHRAEGIGSALLEEIVALANQRACLRLTLLTDAVNLPAQQFYQRAGFRQSPMIAMRLGL